MAPTKLERRALSITVRNLFALVIMIQHDIMEQELASGSYLGSGQLISSYESKILYIVYFIFLSPALTVSASGVVDELNIKSDDLRKFFQKNNIVPYLHPKYKLFFCNTAPEIALTYQWSCTFRQLKVFLSPENVQRHNRNALDPNPSFWERLYLVSFLWVLLGPLELIPQNIDERTLFIDIMANDQNSIDIKQELSAAEQQYMWAKWHIIAATSSVLTRAWCLYEIAARRDAGRGSQLLVAGGEEGAGIGQLEIVMVGPWGLLKMVVIRALVFFSVPLQVGGAILRLIWGIDVSRFVVFDSAYITMKAIGTDYDFFSDMQSSVEEDKLLIWGRALEVFANPLSFNSAIMTATMRFGSNRLHLALLLWLEALLHLVGLAAQAVSGVLALAMAGGWALCHLCLRLCGQSDSLDDGDFPDFVRMMGMSRLGYKFFTVWWMSDIYYIKPILFAAILAAIAPPWAAAAAPALLLGVCCGSIWRPWAEERYEAGHGWGWEMSSVLALALAAPLAAPLAALTVLLSLAAGRDVLAGVGAV